MEINDRVVFIGPEYQNAAGPTIGQLGTVTQINSGTSQQFGCDVENLITVMFDGDSKATVLGECRLRMKRVAIFDGVDVYILNLTPELDELLTRQMVEAQTKEACKVCPRCGGAQEEASELCEDCGEPITPFPATDALYKLVYERLILKPGERVEVDQCLCTTFDWW